MMRASPELLGGFTFVMQWFWATGPLVLSESIESIHSKTGRGGAAFTRPPQDRLYKDSFGHNGDQCDGKQPRSLDRNQLHQCGDREGALVQLFQCCISSVDTVMKNTQDRNDFARVMNFITTRRKLSRSWIVYLVCPREELQTMQMRTRTISGICIPLCQQQPVPESCCYPSNQILSLYSP